MSAVTTTRGNCLLLDDGEPCVCVQSISFSLMCRWFRVAVLPLDEELAAALLVPGEPETVRGLRRGLCPQIQPGEILPRLRRAHEETQAAERKRKQRHKCHALEPFKPA